MKTEIAFGACDVLDSSHAAKEFQDFSSSNDYCFAIPLALAADPTREPLYAKIMAILWI